MYYAVGAMRDVYPSVRLVDASMSSTNVGVLQVRTATGLGSVCGMNTAAATVACRQLGFKYGSVSPSQCRHYGGADICGPNGSVVSMQHLTCEGDELDVQSCKWTAPEELCAKHEHDAIVYCGNAPASRLVEEGSSRLIGADGSPSLGGTGRLEIYRGGAWVTVCASGFTHGSAQMACKQMGFTGAADLHGSQACHASSHEDYCGAYPPALSELACDGSERDLLSCAFEEGSDVFCAPAENVVLRCLGDGDAQGRPAKGIAARVATTRLLPHHRGQRTLMY
jgi:rhodanese-related sulfurtransferase